MTTRAAPDAAHAGAAAAAFSLRNRGDPLLPDAAATRKMIDQLFERREVYARDDRKLEELTNAALGYRVVACLNITSLYVQNNNSGTTKGAGAGGGQMAARGLRYSDLTPIGQRLLREFFALASIYHGHTEEKFSRALGAAAQEARATGYEEDRLAAMATAADEVDPMAVDGEDAEAADDGGAARAQRYDARVTVEPLLSSEGRVMGYRFLLYSRFPLQRFTIEAVEAASSKAEAKQIAARNRRWATLRQQIKKERQAADAKYDKAATTLTARLEREYERARARRQAAREKRNGATKRGRANGQRVVSAPKRRRVQAPDPLPPPPPTAAAAGEDADALGLLEGPARLPASPHRHLPPAAGPGPMSDDLSDAPDAEEHEEEEEEAEDEQEADAREEVEEEGEEEEDGHDADAIAAEVERRLSRDAFRSQKLRDLEDEYARKGPRAMDEYCTRSSQFRLNAVRIFEATRRWVSLRFQALKAPVKRLIFGNAAPHYPPEYNYLRIDDSPSDVVQKSYLSYYHLEDVRETDNSTTGGAGGGKDTRGLLRLHDGAVATADIQLRLSADTFTLGDAFVFGGILRDSCMISPAYYDPASYFPTEYHPAHAHGHRHVVPRTRATTQLEREQEAAFRHDIEHAAPPPVADAMDLEEEEAAAPETPPSRDDERPIKTQDLKRYWQHVRQVLPAIFAPGAPVPTAFPRPDTVLFVQPVFCQPELLPDMPAPFDWHGKADDQLDDYVADVDSLVDQRRHARLFAHYLVTRYATSNMATPDGVQAARLVAAAALGRLNEQNYRLPDETDEAFEARQQAYLNGLSVTDREVTDVTVHLLALDMGAASRRLADIEEIEQDRERLVVFANSMAGLAHTRLRRWANRYKGGDYPYLLTPYRGDVDDSDAATRHAEHLREHVYLLPATRNGVVDPAGFFAAADGAVEGAPVAAPVAGGPNDMALNYGRNEQEIEMRGLAAIADNQALELQLDDRTYARVGGRFFADRYGADDDAADMPEGYKSPTQLADEQRCREALEQRIYAGPAGNMSKTMIEQSAHIQMKIKNSARFAEAARRIRESDAGTSEKLALQRAAVFEAVKESLECAMSTENESQTFQTIRAAAFQLMRGDEDGLLLPPQPIINDDLTTSYLTWWDSNTMPIYDVSNKAQHGLRLLAFSADSHMHLPEAGGNSVSPNILFTGKNSVGKSFDLSTMAQMLLPGTCLNFSHITTHALASGRNNSFGIFVFHEAPTAFFIDTNDRSNSKKVERAAGGDPQKVQMLKNMLTEHSLTTMTLTIDEKTGARRTEVHQSLTYNLWFFAINWDTDMISPPVMSRMLPYEFRSTYLENAKIHTTARDSARVALEIHRVTTKHQKLHALVFFVHSILAMGAVPEGILIENAKNFRDDLVTRLNQDFNFSRDPFTPRFFQMSDHMATNLAIRQTAWALLGTDYGRHWVKTHGFMDPTSFHSFVGFILPRLFVEVSQMLFTVSLLSYRFDSAEQQDLFLILATLLNASDHQRHRPLKRKDGHGLPGTQTLTQQYIITPQLRRRAQEQLRAHTQAHAEAAAAAAAPAPAQGQQRGMAPAVAAALGGDPVTNAIANIMLAPEHGDADEQPRAAAAASTPTGEGSEEQGQIARSAPEVDGRGGVWITDNRYLTLEYGKWKEFIGAFIKHLETKCSYTLRPEAIESIIHQHEKQQIQSPYYDRNPEDGSLFVVRDARTGLVPVDNIPIMKLYREDSIIAVSVQYFSSHLSIAMVLDDVERLMRVVRMQNISDASVRLFERELTRSADDRLLVPKENARNAGTEHFVARLSEVNLARHTTAIAALGAISQANLGRTSLPEEDEYDNRWEEERAQKRFLTAWAPNNFLLEVDPTMPLVGADALEVGPLPPLAPGAAARTGSSIDFLNLAGFMQTLTATRSPDSANVPTFENTRHLGVTGMLQVKATLSGKDQDPAHVTAENSAILHDLTHTGRKFLLDYDYVSSGTRLLTLGYDLHPDDTGERIVRELGVPIHEPSTYPPNASLLFKRFQQLCDRQHQRLVTDVTYPNSDIQELIHKRTNVQVRRRRGLLSAFETVKVQAFGENYHELAAQAWQRRAAATATRQAAQAAQAAHATAAAAAHAPGPAAAEEEVEAEFDD